MSASLPVTKAICFAFLNQLLYTIIEVDAWSEIREISQTEYLSITPRACVGHGWGRPVSSTSASGITFLLKTP